MSFVLLLGISIYITFYNLNTMSCESILLPLLMERVGERRIKPTINIFPHPSPFDNALGRLLPQGRRSRHLC
jgi:hypothetical protein